ncbi:NrsF family protein [Phyllobacterium endophyticum]|uniref:DUF1109 domain-containing protein n=1 Tax=Phyllobacterium endophyticum TaxID=1149773 RepID=A0A2P7AKV0_9HYPH|nr:DUF1109 domain-containing protein [Phyllobacterium endophyticum]MBB3233315.1 hypothetical protein [Phyllobacterium endophyticum]PSH54806.1 hypothetical protein CU100_24810 [Phyllobacterium endophyticum]TYR43325.1 DUF1109 family protein [Phyllobacterium endophyticum]
MTTDDLIARLTGELKPVPRTAVLRRVAIGLGSSLAASATLMYFWLGMRPDLMTAMETTPFWAKFVYTLSLAIAGAWALKRIAHPLGSIRINLALMGALIVAIGILGFMQLAMAPPEAHYYLLTGHSVSICTLNIVVLSLPLLAGAFWILSGLAPTRLTVAGAAAGLASGAIASLVYSFHCTESGMPFIAIWYTLGVLVPGLIGAIAGRYVLRW